MNDSDDISNDKNRSVYIDAENFTPYKWRAIEKFLLTTPSWGEKTTVHIFGHAPSLITWSKAFGGERLPLISHETNFKTKGKNHADIQMSLYIMEDVLINKINSIGIVTSDIDFSPICETVIKKGGEVTVFADFTRGKPKYKKEFALSTTDFYHVDDDNTVVAVKSGLGFLTRLSSDQKKHLVNFMKVFGHLSHDKYHPARSIASIANHMNIHPIDCGARSWNSVMKSMANEHETLFELVKDKPSYATFDKPFIKIQENPDLPSIQSLLKTGPDSSSAGFRRIPPTFIPKG